MMTTATDDRPYRRIHVRLGEVLRLSFWVWVKNLVPFTLLAVLLHGPLIAWAAALLATNAEPARFETFQVISVYGGGLVQALLSAAVTYGVVMELDRKPQPIGRIVATGLRRFLPAVAVSIVSALAVFLGSLLLIVPGLIVTCMLYVAVPASVIERPGLRGALARSRALTAGNRVKLFALALLTVVVNLAITTVVYLLVVGVETEGHEHLMSVIELGRSLLFAPLYATVTATTYVLLRRQRDGVAADELAAVFA